MPYYCTVPQCTSMAGKAKNVSFHQFPRDEELARLWNLILKRGKPYTKYSKVCSLHFRPEDYTITSVGKNKGQWRTLRKDAIPSRNLPSSTPPPTNHHQSGNRRNSGAWLPGASPAPTSLDPRLQHQMAQAIYMQTMLAMQARQSENGSPTGSEQQRFTLSDIEQLLHQRNIFPEVPLLEKSSYKCNECSKCFKDPDVFILHKRSHTHVSRSRDSNVNQKNDYDKSRRVSDSNSDRNHVNDTGNDAQDNDYVQDNDNDRCINREINRNHVNDTDRGSDVQDNDSDGQENDSNDRVTENHRSNVENGDNRQETLRANPILANLLRTGVDGINGNVFDVNNILSIENQIMTALAANMENYIKNLTHLLAEAKKEKEQELQEGQDTDEVNDTCQSDRQSDQDNDTCQSDKQSDLNGESDGENCQITDGERNNDDESEEISKRSDRKSKNKSKNKNVAVKSKSIKKRGRKRRVSMQKVMESTDSSKITNIQIEFSENDLEKHEAMDVDGQKNDEQTNDDCSENLDSSQNGIKSKLESKSEHNLQENCKNSSDLEKRHNVTVKNEYDSENLDIEEPDLLTLSDVGLSPSKNKGLTPIRESPKENECENHESQNCTLTFQNHYEKSLKNKQNHHLVSENRLKPKNSSKRKDLKEVKAKIELNSSIDDSDYTKKYEKVDQHSFTTDEKSSKNSQTDSLKEVDSIGQNSSNICQNNYENIVKSDKKKQQKLQNDGNSVKTDQRSPKYDHKSVQTEGKCDGIEESLYPAPACDTHDLKDS